MCGYLEADVKRVADDLLLTDDGPPLAPPEPEQRELKVSRTPKAEEKPRARRKAETAKSSRARPKSAEQKKRAKAEVEGEEPTQEFAAVGAVGDLEEAGEGLDWGFGDDPSDYSAAV